MSRSILALDPATKTGWASTEEWGGVFELPEAECFGEQLHAFETWLVVKQFSLDKGGVFVYERAHHRGGAATRLALGLSSIIELIAYQSDFKVVSVHTATLKKHATGKGNAQKFEMMAAARQQHPQAEIVDDNHCDALWLLHWAVAEGYAEEK